MTQLGPPGASCRERLSVGLATCAHTAPWASLLLKWDFTVSPLPLPVRRTWVSCPRSLSAHASKFHPGPLPSALASWQEAGYGFLMFPLQTRPGRARVWTRVRPGPAPSCPPHSCQSHRSATRQGCLCSGPPGSEGRGRGASDLTQKVSLDWDPSEGRTPLTRAPRSRRAQRVTRFLLRLLLWFLCPSRLEHPSPGPGRRA